MGVAQIKVNDIFLQFVLPALSILSSDAFVLTKTSNACYSSGGDCGFHFLSCDSGLVISLRALRYGFKPPDVYARNQCELALTDCANYVSRQSCCQYEARTDCLRIFSSSHMGQVTKDCQGQVGCTFHATRVSGGCQKPPLTYDKVSSYSVIQYDCVQESELTRPAHEVTPPSRPGSSGLTVTPSTAVIGCDGCATSRETTEEDARDQEKQRSENMLQLIVGVSVGVGSGIIALVIIAAVCWIRIRRKPPETAPSSPRSAGVATAGAGGTRRHSSRRHAANSNTASSSVPSSLYSSFLYSDTIPSSHPDSLYATPPEAGSRSSSFGRQSRGSRVRNYGFDSEAEPRGAGNYDYPEPRAAERNYGYLNEADTRSVRNYGFEGGEEEPAFNRNYDSRVTGNYDLREEEKPHASGNEDFEHETTEPALISKRPPAAPKSSERAGRGGVVSTAVRAEGRNADPRHDEVKKETRNGFPEFSTSPESRTRRGSERREVVPGFPDSGRTIPPVNTGRPDTALYDFSHVPPQQPPSEAFLMRPQASSGHHVGQAMTTYPKESAGKDALRRGSGEGEGVFFDWHRNNQPIRDPLTSSRHSHGPVPDTKTTKNRRPPQLPILDSIANAASRHQRRVADNNMPPPPLPPPRQDRRMPTESAPGSSPSTVYATPDKTRGRPDPVQIRADMLYPDQQPYQTASFIPWSQNAQTRVSNHDPGHGMTNGAPSQRNETHGAGAPGNVNGANVPRGLDNQTNLPGYRGIKNTPDHQRRRGYLETDFGNVDIVL